jgi:capsular exopolysaccharide synthesis family protein
MYTMDNRPTNNNGQEVKPSIKAPIQQPNLMDYLPVIWRGKWIVLSIVLIVFNIAFYYTSTQEPKYVAQVSVFVNTQGQRSQAPLAGLVIDDYKNIANEIELLKSRMIAEAVAEVLMNKRLLDETSDEPIPITIVVDEETSEIHWLSHRAVAERVMGAVDFSHQRDTDFITITARSNNNREAALIANTYAQVYYDRNFARSRQQSRSVREFLEEQLSIKREDLSAAEQEFRRYMEAHGVVQIDEETRRVIEQMSELEAQREATDVEIQSLKSTYASLRSQLEEQEPHLARNISSADNPYIRMIQEQMAALEVERDLTITQNPNAREDERYSRMIADIDEQLEGLRQNLHRRTAEFMESMAPSVGDDPAGYVKQLRQRLLEADITLQGLEYRRAALDESLTRYETQFNRLPRVVLDYARLQRSRASSERLYLMLEERYNEALITEQSEFGSVDIIDQALVPGSPVSPNHRINLITGLFLGFGLGIGFVILRESLFGSIRTPEDLQKHGYHTLTTVASMDRELKKVSKNGKITKNGKILDAHLVMLSDPLSASAETFRLLRTKLKFAQVDRKFRSLVITSPSPGEGKTTVIVNMAISYAQAGERVLLIDCDLRKPALASKLNLLAKPGLTEVLVNELSFYEAVQPTVIENLDFLASGRVPANPAEILGSNAMKSLITMLSDRYRIILFDSPPVLAASDPLVLSTLTDTIILVSASGKTKMKELDFARENIASVGSHITGVVLNFFDYRKAYGSYYTYQYHRYGRYGYLRDGKGGGKLKEEKVE